MLVIQYLASDHKIPGSNPCKVEVILLIRSDIMLSPLFRSRSLKNYKSEAEFNISNKLRC